MPASRSPSHHRAAEAVERLGVLRVGLERGREGVTRRRPLGAGEVLPPGLRAAHTPAESDVRAAVAGVRSLPLAPSCADATTRVDVAVRQAVRGWGCCCAPPSSNGGAPGAAGAAPGARSEGGGGGAPNVLRWVHLLGCPPRRAAKQAGRRRRARQTRVRYCPAAAGLSSASSSVASPTLSSCVCPCAVAARSLASPAASKTNISTTRSGSNMICDW